MVLAWVIKSVILTSVNPILSTTNYLYDEITRLFII